MHIIRMMYFLCTPRKSCALHACFERWDELNTRFWVGWYMRTMRWIEWKRLQKTLSKISRY